MCKYLGGWVDHTTEQLKDEKLCLLSIIDDLELEAITEVPNLSEHKMEQKIQSSTHVNLVRRAFSSSHT
jgi:hypothetical protein